MRLSCGTLAWGLVALSSLPNVLSLPAPNGLSHGSLLHRKRSPVNAVPIAEDLKPKAKWLNEFMSWVAGLKMKNEGVVDLAHLSALRDSEITALVQGAKIPAFKSPDGVKANVQRLMAEANGLVASHAPGTPKPAGYDQAVRLLEAEAKMDPKSQAWKTLSQAEDADRAAARASGSSGSVFKSILAKYEGTKKQTAQLKQAPAPKIAKAVEVQRPNMQKAQLVDPLAGQAQIGHVSPLKVETAKLTKTEHLPGPQLGTAHTLHQAQVKDISPLKYTTTLGQQPQHFAVSHLPPGSNAAHLSDAKVSQHAQFETLPNQASHSVPPTIGGQQLQRFAITNPVPGAYGAHLSEAPQLATHDFPPQLKANVGGLGQATRELVEPIGVSDSTLHNSATMPHIGTADESALRSEGAATRVLSSDPEAVAPRVGTTKEVGTEAERGLAVNAKGKKNSIVPIVVGAGVGGAAGGVGGYLIGKNIADHHALANAVPVTGPVPVASVPPAIPIPVTVDAPGVGPMSIQTLESLNAFELQHPDLDPTIDAELDKLQGAYRPSDQWLQRLHATSQQAQERAAAQAQGATASVASVGPADDVAREVVGNDAAGDVDLTAETPAVTNAAAGSTIEGPATGATEPSTNAAEAEATIQPQPAGSNDASAAADEDA